MLERAGGGGEEQFLEYSFAHYSFNICLYTGWPNKHGCLDGGADKFTLFDLELNL